MRRNRIIINIAVIILSWYAMMMIHEAGHCLGAWVSGAHVDIVTIPIIGFSQTTITNNNNPLLTTWAGPVFGALAPLTLLIFLNGRTRRIKHTLLYFIGFCLIANGAYIGVGAFIRAGDCGDMLKYGSPMWTLILFGSISTTAGIITWHRMGPTRKWFASTK